MYYKAPDDPIEDTNGRTDPRLTRMVTTNYCFVRGARRTRLRLLLNRKLYLRTDYLYTLCLQLDEGLLVALASTANPIRFRVGRLYDKAVKERAVTYVDGSRDVIRTMLAI